MSTKREHLNSIKAKLAECKRLLTLICDSSSTRDQQQACIDTTNALTNIQNEQLKALRRAYLGRA